MSELLKYLDLKTLLTRVSGDVMILHTCLAKSARLKCSKRLKPIHPTSLSLQSKLQGFQATPLLCGDDSHQKFAQILSSSFAKR